jgi:hypothetical protein
MSPFRRSIDLWFFGESTSRFFCGSGDFFFVKIQFSYSCRCRASYRYHRWSQEVLLATLLDCQNAHQPAAEESSDGGWGSVDSTRPITIEMLVLHGLDYAALARWAAGYEALYLILWWALQGSPHEPLRRRGASYGCALVNAFVVTALGAANLATIWDAPEVVKAVGMHTPGEPWYNETQVDNPPPIPRPNSHFLSSVARDALVNPRPLCRAGHSRAGRRHWRRATRSLAGWLLTSRTSSRATPPSAAPTWCTASTTTATANQPNCNRSSKNPVVRVVRRLFDSTPASTD